MAYYIKVTQQVCKKLGHGIDRNDTADANKLLWQADIDGVEGDTVFDRAATVGGACLDSWAAKAEIDGVDNPVEVFTPEAYRDPEPVPEEQPAEEVQPAEENPSEGESVPSDEPVVEQTNEGGMS